MKTFVSIIIGILYFHVLGECTALAQVGNSAYKGFRQPSASVRSARVSNRHQETLHSLTLPTSPTDTALPGGVYGVGQGGWLPTLDSAFARISAGGISGNVTITLLDTLYQLPPGRKLHLGAVSGAGPSSRIIIRPAVGTVATIHGDSTAVLEFVDTKYLTLDGRSSPPSPSSGIAIHALYNSHAAYNDCIDVLGDADHNEFLYLDLKSDDPRNVFPDFGGSGIFLGSLGTSYPDSNLIEGNIVNAVGGIFVIGTDVRHIRHTVIRANTVGSPTENLLAWGIQSECADGTLIDGNTVQFIRNAYHTGDNHEFAIGINAYANTNSIICNNVVHSMFGSDSTRLQGVSGTGTNAAGTTGVNLQIYNNMIYNLQNSSTKGDGWIEGIAVWENYNTLVAYNTVYLSGTGANPAGVDALGFWWLGGTNLTMKNNLLVNLYHQTGGGYSTAVYATGTTFTSDYNNLYVDTSLSTSFTVISVPNQTAQFYPTLTDWQTAGHDVHGLGMLPVFSAPHLHIDSTQAPADLFDGHGTPMTDLLFDIDGQLRDAASPDMGADEYTSAVSDVEDNGSTLPTSYRLNQNFPNPFNPTTTIWFEVPVVGLVTLKITNIIGQEVATLVNRIEEPGYKSVVWDASRAPSGIYFCRLTAGGHTAVRKLIVLR